MRRRGKFNAKRTQKDGIKFASKKEAKRYSELKLLERAGEIRNLKPHPRYPLSGKGIEIRYPNGRVAVYTADAEYIEDGETITEDTKSSATLTGESKLRMATFTAIYDRPVRIHI